jgi:hypothetical protein
MIFHYLNLRFWIFSDARSVKVTMCGHISLFKLTVLNLFWFMAGEPCQVWWFFWTTSDWRLVRRRYGVGGPPRCLIQHSTKSRIFWVAMPCSLYTRFALLAAYFILISWLTLQPWRWRRYVSLKRQWTSTELNGLTTQKIILFTVLRWELHILQI